MPAPPPNFDLLMVFAPFPILAGVYLAVGILPPWFLARRHGIRLSIWRILNMRMRMINAYRVVQTLIVVEETHYPASLLEVEIAYEEGADLDQLAVEIREQATKKDKLGFQKLLDRHLAHLESQRLTEVPENSDS